MWYLAKSYELKKNTYFQRNISHELLNTFIPYQFFKLLLKSSHNIESALSSSIFLSRKSAIFNHFDLAPFCLSLAKSTFTWDPKWTQTGLRFHYGIKFHFGVRWLHQQRTHDFGWSETHFYGNFTSVELTEVKFQTEVSFPCKHLMPAVKQSRKESLKLLTGAHVSCCYCLKNNQ